MRINPNQGADPLQQSGRLDNASSASPAASSSSGGALGEDQAQLSGAHVQVQALAAQALQLPAVRQDAVRQEKVSALRQAILGGSYHPDSEQVAEALMGHMMVLSAA